MGTIRIPMCRIEKTISNNKEKGGYLRLPDECTRTIICDRIPLDERDSALRKRAADELVPLYYAYAEKYGRENVEMTEYKYFIILRAKCRVQNQILFVEQVKVETFQYFTEVYMA